MAVISHTTIAAPGADQSKVVIVKWGPLANGDTGEPIQISAKTDVTVQAFGTFGAGGSVSIQGANEIASPTYAIINDSRGEGNPMTFTAADVRQTMEAPLTLRPTVTAGDGTTALTIVVKCVGK